MKVLEVMAKFQSRTNTDEQLNNASLPAPPGVGNPNTSSVSRVEQAVLTSEENTVFATRPTSVDEVVSTGVAVVEQCSTHSPTNRDEGIQIQQLPGDDRETAECANVYFLDLASPYTFVNSDKSVGEKAMDAVDKSDGSAREADSCSHLTASVTVSPEGVQTEQLTTEEVGGWQRSRGRGRGRGHSILSLSSLASSAGDTAVGERARVLGEGRTGRGRARSRVWQSCIGIEKDSSTEWAVGCLERGKGQK